MKRPVNWSREALDDIKEQVRHIAKDDYTVALRVGDKLRDTGNALGAMPTGRPGRVSGTYEKSVSRLPYIIAYSITAKAGGEAITILRVIHTSRDWPEDDWPE